MNEPGDMGKENGGGMRMKWRLNAYQSIGCQILHLYLLIISL